ncbi:hypothetical protein TKK_0015633 [Trichogramma kaykai]
MGFEEKMRAARSKYVPPIPRNLKKLGSMLEEYKPMKGLFRGMVKGDKKEVALIFIHDDMIEPLNECCHLYMDGTFSMRSLIPGFRQIYIIHFRKLDAGFASIFVFLSSQTKTMYDVMWRGIFELVPKLKVNVTTIMCDFERAQIASLKENFDKVDICGCLFHYKSAIVKKWGKFRIIGHDHILEKAYAIPHLPSDRITDGINHIIDLIDEVDNNVALENFGKYLRKQWNPIRDVLSIFRNPVRTNNTCENFHLHATKYWKTQNDLENAK